MTMRVLLPLLAATIVCTARVPAHYTIDRATTRIDATQSYVSIVSTIELSAIAGQYDSPFFVAFPAGDGVPRLAFIGATLAESDIPLNASRVDAVNEPLGWVHFSVRLGAEAVQAATLKLVTVWIDALEPDPPRVEQAAHRHLVRLRFSPLLASPYAVLRQTTTLRLPSAAIEHFPSSFGGVVVDRDGAKLKFGPFADVTAPYFGDAPQRALTEVGHDDSAETGAFVSVIFPSPESFLTVTGATREVDASGRWGSLFGFSVGGSIAVDETYVAMNAGAALAGPACAARPGSSSDGFSRVDYQTRRVGNSVRGITALLPRGAAGVYYRDDLGNVSSSHLREEETRSLLQFQLRFPLFGGWKTEWRLGYTVPAGGYLSEVAASGDGDAASGLELRRLAIGAHLSLPAVPVHEYALSVVLPLGAELVSATAPFPHTTAVSARPTLLNALAALPAWLTGQAPPSARPVVTLRATGPGISSGSGYDGDVVVEYRQRWAGPLLLALLQSAVAAAVTAACAVLTCRLAWPRQGGKMGPPPTVAT